MRQEPAVGKKNYKAFTPEIRSIDEKNRTIEFVASTEAVDRYGDIIRVAGWKTSNYEKNPVFLWGHKSGDPPIGKCVEIHTETSPPALVQKIEFADAATYPFADTVFSLFKGKFLNAVSVGFMPLEMPNRITDSEGNATGGYEFTSQELLELSAVPVPANPEAVARMVSKGFGEGDLERVFSPAITAEAVYRELAEINQEIAVIAVGLAKATLLKADELRALLKAARVQAEPGGELTFAELLEAVRQAGPAVRETPASGIETDGGEIETLDQLAAAVGTPDDEPGLYEIFSDSHSLRTGKFHFALRSELR